jgi:hypothetical protein
VSRWRGGALGSREAKAAWRSVPQAPAPLPRTGSGSRCMPGHNDDGLRCAPRADERELAVRSHRHVCYPANCSYGAALSVRTGSGKPEARTPRPRLQVRPASRAFLPAQRGRRRPCNGYRRTPRPRTPDRRKWPTFRPAPVACFSTGVDNCGRRRQQPNSRRSAGEPASRFPCHDPPPSSVPELCAAHGTSQVVERDVEQPSKAHANLGGVRPASNAHRCGITPDRGW